MKNRLGGLSQEFGVWGLGTREGSVAKGWVMQRAMIAVVEPSVPVWVVWLLLALRKVPLEVQVFW